MSAGFGKIDLMIKGDIICCRPHQLEVCSECDLDFNSLNSLHKSLLQINGNIPPPNAVNERLSRQIMGLKEEGNKQFKAENYLEAIRLYTLAIEMAFQRPMWEPHEITAHDVSICLSNRSAAYMGIKSWVNAYVDAEWGIRIKSDYVKGYFRKGKALMAMRRYDEAIKAFEVGLEFAPNDESLKSVLDEAIELKGNEMVE
ncbi:3055_t:CDS:1 [Acaulospora colombiana]|uniref:3055_t:CDS:1 n=1 Tax=Acaulospora colombiana TaxID=27376 RepID=A0ACA9KYC1_9GLOM|nr:3055_t:CDS:1 [Acaulospora colombiana]